MDSIEQATYWAVDDQNLQPRINMVKANATEHPGHLQLHVYIYIVKYVYIYMHLIYTFDIYIVIYIIIVFKVYI